MSENQPEIDEKELEQVAGGGAYTCGEDVQKYQKLTGLGSSVLKEVTETIQGVLQKITH